MKKPGHFFEKGRDGGLLFLRIIIGWRLVAGTWPYALGLKPIQEVTGFFTQLQLPVPLLSSYLSVYAQFIAGILFIIGYWVRPAALLMIINFIIALLAAHTKDGIETSFPAWILLAVSVFLFFNGPGKLSLRPR